MKTLRKVVRTIILETMGRANSWPQLQKIFTRISRQVRRSNPGFEIRRRNKRTFEVLNRNQPESLRDPYGGQRRIEVNDHYDGFEVMVFANWQASKKPVRGASAKHAQQHLFTLEEVIEDGGQGLYDLLMYLSEEMK